ncbi:type IV secretory system conjugative DNA transfer family protein [Cellulomonas aerilata]|uniref:type IV secretory system conjugative DNA transfer family protein n=1 Tax=Cellulomonas aerilata TaxID=515326 RepID=UPI001C99311C|nr:type IV secretory system conjugative DNA transfer family protein [Cellulomonas aerilata]
MVGRPGRERRAAEVRRAEQQRRLAEWRATRPAEQVNRHADPLGAARWLTRESAGCAFLGLDANDKNWVVAHRQQAVLVLGPPRSGKTSSLIIPSVLTASGPVVSTSTKAEIMRATARARAKVGRIWLYDPSGTEEVPAGVLELNWSPIWSARTWDGARAMADAMVGASSAGEGVENGTYWSESSKTLLAPLLHAAALSGKTISDVRRWVSRADVVEAGRTLEAAGAELAADDLDAVAAQTEERERSSIFASTRIVLTAYGSEQAAKRSMRQNFDADKFVRSADTVYITAPSHLQNNLAPLVAGLLEEIRDATYRYARSPQYSDRDSNPVLWALDEVANIAPLKKLPGIVSEAGGQGLQVMACLQDLSQARTRWGTAAEGFLSLFGTKVVFPGIGDRATLEALSMMVGDWDRPYLVFNTGTGTTTTYGIPTGRTQAQSNNDSWTHSTQREARVSAAEISNIPPGHALLVRSGHWSLVETTPYYSAAPWRAALERAPRHIEPHGGPDHLPYFGPGSQAFADRPTE